MKFHSGVDIIDISRIVKLVERYGARFINRHFTDEEILYCNKKGQRHFAGCFAAKEAVFKALKLKWETGFSWKQIEITHKNMKPSALVNRNLYCIDNCFIDVSISYSREHAVALAIIIENHSDIFEST